MKTTQKWLRTSASFVVGLLILLLAWLFVSRFWISGTSYYYGHGMMRNGFTHYLSVPGTLYVWLALVGVVLLLVIGGIWLVRHNAPKSGEAVTMRNTDEPLMCPGCNQEVQANWNYCPYCGDDLP
jgi:hypothetical protein